MIYTILAGITAYIGTNIDDMFINMLLFSTSKNKKDDLAIMLGKYIGTGVLMAVSVAIGMGAKAVIGNWVRLLGIVPLYMAVKRLRDNSEETDDVNVSGNYMLSSAAITIASGGDNIGVYVPLFAGMGAGQLVTVAVIFSIMTLLWCLLGKRLTVMPAIKNTIEKYSHIITPAVYICLGIYILLF